MNDYVLACTHCGSEFDKGSPRFRCGKCNNVLEARYDYKNLILKRGFKKIRISHKKYSQFFPINGNLVSIGEGGTKLYPNVRLKNLKTSKFRLYLKVENTNPTRTFKDRGSSVEITKASELGFGEVCCASTGNMGLSIATYAKKAKIRCTVFISKDANREKMEKIERAGARIIRVNGDFNRSLLLAEKFAVKNNVFLCGDYHYRKEGQKSMAFEIIEQLRYKVPDYVFVQVGNSTLLAAIYKGLSEFKKAGLIKSFPKLVAIQSKKCDPLVHAYMHGRRISYVVPETKADAIAVGYPTFGFEGLGAIRSTRGFADYVSDEEMQIACEILEKYANIKSELAGAAGFAGFLKLYSKNKKRFENKDIVVIITGNNED